MSTYGLKLTNADNETLIDGVYKNYCVSEEGSVTFTINGSEWATPFCYHSITDTVALPIVAFKVQSGKYVSVQSYKDVTTSIVHAATVNNTTIDYRVYRQAKASDIPSADGYGLVCYNADGEIVFHSFNKWLKIVNIFTFTTPVTDIDVELTVANANDNYFVIIPWTPFFVNIQTGPSSGVKYFITAMLTKVSSTSIKYARKSCYTTGGPPIHYSNGFIPATAIVLELKP